MPPYPNTNLLEVKNLAFGYNAQPLFNNVALSLKKGSSLSIVGASGSGKSTLLKTLIGHLPAIRGSVEIKGQHVEAGLTLTGEHPSITYLNQTFSLLSNLPIRENFSRALKHLPVPRQKVLIEAMVETFNLNTLINRTPNQISIGQQQRVALALALIKPVDILVLDEPFSHQDALNKPWVLDSTRQLIKQAKTTLILVSHSITDCLLLTRSALLLNTETNATWQGSWLQAQRSNLPVFAALFHNLAYQKTYSGVNFYRIRQTGSQLTQAFATQKSIARNADTWLTHYQTSTGIAFTLAESKPALKGQPIQVYLEPLG